MSRNDLPNEKAPNFNARLRETLMTYLGKSGDPLDRGITLRDLLESKLADIPSPSLAKSGAVLPLTPGSAIAGVVGSGTAEVVLDLTPPPSPTGLTATAAIATILIEVDRPVYTLGHGHFRTHIYGAIRASQNDPAPVFSDAAEIMQFSGTAASYSTSTDTTWHLWAKWESSDGVLSASPAGGTNGVAVTTGVDVPSLVRALTGQITEDQLYETLGARINLIDGPSTLDGSVAARIATETTARTNADTAITDSVTTLTSTVGGHTTTLATHTSSINGLQAEYTVKIDNNGYVTGFGLASTLNTATPYSQFSVRSDAFYIANPGGPGVSPAMPFIVRTTPTTINGVSVPVGVYITDTFIQNGTITNAKIADAAIDNAKIANLSADKINAGTLDAARIATGSLDAKIASIDAAVITSGTFGTARIGSGAITNAQINDGVISFAKITNNIQSTDYAAGSAGWKIDKSGSIELNNATFRGTLDVNSGVTSGARMVITQFTLSVYDDAGVLRVKIGKLT